MASVFFWYEGFALDLNESFVMCMLSAFFFSSLGFSWSFANLGIALVAWGLPRWILLSEVFLFYSSNISFVFLLLFLQTFSISLPCSCFWCDIWVLYHVSVFPSTIPAFSIFNWLRSSLCLIILIWIPIIFLRVLWLIWVKAAWQPHFIPRVDPLSRKLVFSLSNPSIIKSQPKDFRLHEWKPQLSISLIFDSHRSSLRYRPDALAENNNMNSADLEVIIARFYSLYIDEDDEALRQRMEQSI